jgi:hypothetical protein
MCVLRRDGTSALPLGCDSTNHTCYSKRHRSALGKQLQPAEPEAVSRNGSLVLMTAARRPPTATDSMDTGLE